MHRCPALPTFLSPDFLSLPKDFGNLYFVSNRSYWVLVSFFESRVLNPQKIFWGWHNVECFSVRSLDRVKYYCSVPSWRIQYEPLTLLFVRSSFVLAYYSVVAMRGSAADQIRIWTIALSEYVFMARAMFIVNAKNGACSTYHIGNLQLSHVYLGLLFPP